MRYIIYPRLDMLNISNPGYGLSDYFIDLSDYFISNLFHRIYDLYLDSYI